MLLDDNFKAKLSDFGLAREGPKAGHSHVSTAVCMYVSISAQLILFSETTYTNQLIHFTKTTNII